MPQLNEFFMVLRDGTTYTSYRHNTESSAKFEAKRLALQFPGSIFFVLKLCTAFIEPVKEPQEIEIISDDVPF